MASPDVATIEGGLPKEIHPGNQRYWLGPIVAGVVCLLLWELSVRVFAIPAHFIPAPSAIAKSFQNNIPLLLRHLTVTAIETYAGFGISLVAGVLLAVLVDRSPWLRAIIHPYVIAFQATPKVALAPFLVLWFGFGISSKIAAAAVIAFFPVFINTLAGFTSLSPQVMDLMKALRASRWEILWKAKIPHALPYVFAGLEIGMSLSLIGALVGEFISSTAGLGYLIENFNYQLQIPAAFATLFVLALFGLLSYGLVVWLKYRVVFWLGKV